jgi:micrococcal nuclease
MRRRHLTILLLFLLLAGTYPGCAAPVDAAVCVVGRIVDGDTLVCDGGVRIRLLLIDAPELSQGHWGEVARDVLATLAPPGTPLRLERDVQPRDRFGRTLAYLWLDDGRMVNEELLRAGVAVVSVHPPNVRHVERLREAVVEAREARTGLWATSAFECEPADHRAGRC